MDFESILQQALTVAGTYNRTLVILLFVICAIGEFHIAVPYLLETIWLLSGYHFGTGVLPLFDLLFLWLVAQAGRQAGATALFYLTRLGSMPVKKVIHRYFDSNPSAKVTGNDSLPMRLWRRMAYLSPLSIAMGRLFWMRIPLTLALALQKRLGPLWIGIALSAIVWDGIYIAAGIIGGHTALTPVQMLLYSLVGLSALYVLTFALRQLSRALSRRKIRTS